MRVRTILHVAEPALRVEAGTDDAGKSVFCLSRAGGHARIRLDPYGLELLAATIVNARLMLGDDALAEERCDGPFPCRFRYRPVECLKAIEIEQDAQSLLIPECFWERLYAELTLVMAHARHSVASSSFGARTEPCPRRILH